MNLPLTFRCAGSGGIAVGVGLILLAHGYSWRDGRACTAVHNPKIVLHTVEESLVHYRADHAQPCPPSLQALVDEHYLTRLPLDQRRRPLLYVCPGSHVPPSAAGKDGRFGTGDALGSWDL